MKGTERIKSRQETGLYTRTTGYGADDVVTSWEGRGAAGELLGIIELTVNIPFIPGNINNASTFDFPVRHESMGDIDPHWVVSDEPHPEVIKRAVAAGQRLQQRGCRAVMGNCGFFANYQNVVAAELDVPFFGSSLMQIPMMLASMGSDQIVGVLTANGPALEGADALEQSGVASRDRLVIYGMQDEPEFSSNLLSTTGRLRPQLIENELVAKATQMVEDHPNIGAICLECTEFPPHAHAIQNAVRRPMWGFTTLAHWIHDGLVRHRYKCWR
ncbi:MAG: aspartate/glutamate racemase family protein [Microthrixaceae bacterium]